MSTAIYRQAEPYDPYAETPAEPYDPFAEPGLGTVDPFALVVTRDPFAVDTHPNLKPVTSSTAFRLNVPRREAQQQRARALVQLTMGNTTLDDLVSQAATPAGAPLLAIRLTALLEARPGAGPAAAAAVMTRLSCTLGYPVPITSDMGWLLDGRARGRYVGWLTATGRANPSPWAGFPFTLSPAEGQE